MYPILKEGVSFGIFQYEDSNIIHYYIENNNGEEFEISHRLWKALLHADGTKPLDLPNKGKGVIPKLKKYGFVQTSRFIHDESDINRFILFPIGRKCQNSSFIYKLINALLPVISILIFLIGVHFINSAAECTEINCNLWLYYGLVIISIVLHEVGHLVAGITYNYKISDIGLLLFGILPVGGYISYEDKKDVTIFEQIQFSLAGIEMNLLIAGVCWLIATKIYSQQFLLYSIAKFNVLSAVINCLPASGLDGERALSAICGVRSISAVARKQIMHKKYRFKLLHSGFLGYFRFCFFLVIMFAKAIIWLIIAFDFLLIFL